MEVCLLVASVLVTLLTVSDGCSPPIGRYVPPTLDLKMSGSDAVVQGIPLSTEPDTRHPTWDVYNVKFEVHCVYKGAPVDRIIHIDGVGYIPGHCTSTNLTVGQEYLVYLYRYEQDRYKPRYAEDPANDDYLEEIVVLCETRIGYPTGYDEHTSKNKCPNPATENDCQPNFTTDPQLVARSVPTDPENPDNEIPDMSGVAEQSKEDKMPNASTALTWHLITLLLALSIFLL